MSKLTNFDIPASLETVWTALHEYQDECIPEGGTVEVNDEETAAFAAENVDLWSDITTAMAWITEALGYEVSTADDETNGEYVQEFTDPVPLTAEENLVLLETAANRAMEVHTRSAAEWGYYSEEEKREEIAEADTLKAICERNNHRVEIRA